MSFAIRAVSRQVEEILCQSCPSDKRKIVAQEMPGCGHRFCHTCITSQVKDGELSCLHKTHNVSDCQQTAKKTDLLSIRLNIQGGCPICLEENQHDLAALPCGHAYHLGCIYYATEPKRSNDPNKNGFFIPCPDCRKETTYDAIADPRNERVVTLLDFIAELAKPKPNLEFVQGLLGEQTTAYGQLFELISDRNYNGAKKVLEGQLDQELDAIAAESGQAKKTILDHLTHRRKGPDSQAPVIPPEIAAGGAAFDPAVLAAFLAAPAAGAAAPAPVTSEVGEWIELVFKVIFSIELFCMLVGSFTLSSLPLGSMLGLSCAFLGTFLLTYGVLLEIISIFENNIPDADRVLNAIFDWQRIALGNSLACLAFWIIIGSNQTTIVQAYLWLLVMVGLVWIITELMAEVSGYFGHPIHRL